MATTGRSKLASGNASIRAVIESSVGAFGESSAEEKEKRKEKALTDLFYFARTYFPHHITEKPSVMHRELYASYQSIILLSEKTGQGAREVRAAPRGNAKSTLSTLILPLWCVVGKRRRFIGVLSDTTEQAEEFLESIKAELEANERLREDFPDACTRGRTWQAGQIITQSGVKIKCWGKRKRLRGARHGARRPDLIICDDLEDDENIDSPEQREKDRAWFFKAVMKIGGRYSVYIVIGTLLHYDSLLARLLNQPGWRGKKWQAVIKWSASPLWERWENIFIKDGEETADAFFKKNKREMLKGTQELWPEGEPYYYLMKIRLADGPAYFDSEKQNEPIHPSERLFNDEWFQYWNDENLSVKGGLEISSDETIIAAVDPSMGGASSKADPSAIVIAIVRKNGVLDILEADIQKRHPDGIMEDLFVWHQMYRLDRVVIEEVQFQELFKEHVTREGAKRGLYLPIEGTRPHTDKTLRISKLQPHIKNGFIRFRRKQISLLNQLKYFPKADHDDGPDALEMVFSLAHAQSIQPRIRRVL